MRNKHILPFFVNEHCEFFLRYKSIHLPFKLTQESRHELGNFAEIVKNISGIDLVFIYYDPVNEPVYNRLQLFVG